MSHREKIKVVFYNRKPIQGFYSIEGLYRIIQNYLPETIESVSVQSRFPSQGLIKRVYNTIEAIFRQGDVNHITGDIHYVIYLLNRKKTILTIQDSVYEFYLSGIKKAIIKFFWYTLPIKKARLVVVSSEASRQVLLKSINCSPDKIRVIPHFISPEFQFTPYIFNSEKPVILQIGTARNKNLVNLAEALNGISCKLDIIGKLSAEQLAVLKKNGIDYQNSYDLSAEEVIQKYHNCDLLAFVSLYEGFGLPVLEANAVGRPVVTANRLSMPEVAGDSACLVDPENIEDIRHGILKVINDSIYREELVKNGLKNITRFNLKNIAKQYVDLYNEIAEP